MAPDLNSIPRSPVFAIPPRQISSTSPSRRPSLGMPHGPSPTLASTSEQFPAMPVRHPTSRPMTPAELHSEVEKEQEAVVNRLTRELSTLRAHSFSAASLSSTTSTTSTNPFHRLEPTTNTSAIDTTHFAPTPRHPTTARQHRSSSSLSSRTRSLTSSSSSFAQIPTIPTTAPNPPTAPPPSGTTLHSQASVDRARDAAGLPQPHQHHPPRSRQNSAIAPSPSPSTAAPEGSIYFHPRTGSSTNAARGIGMSALLPAGARVEELGQAKAALEAACVERDELVKRIRELESELKSLPTAGEGRERERGRSGRPRGADPGDGVDAAAQAGR